MKPWFTLPESAQFNTSLNLCWISLLQCSFNKTRWAYLESGNMFWTIYFITFDFIILSDLNSDPNNPIKIWSITTFLADCLVT